jgi:molybdenum cofactor cytidylyltransferase
MSDQANLEPGKAIALLLAAGESTRMGRPKPLLTWEGQTLIEYQIAQLLEAGVDEVIAVLGHRAEDVRSYAERAGARVVVNAAYREGRAGSIRTGAEALPADTGAIVILNVDQPRTSAAIRPLIEAHRRGGHLITVPVFAGRRGHPAVLSGQLAGELRQVDEASEGLRAVMQRHMGERVEVPIDDPAVLLDMNLPADYEAAVRGRASEAVGSGPQPPTQEP